MRGDQLSNGPCRILLVGYPGTGKTGSLACLANAGYKIRVLDFDGNYQSLLEFTEPAKRQNIDILSFEDRLGLGAPSANSSQYGPMAVVGIPSAFNNAIQALNRWRYEDPEGTVKDEKTGKTYTDLGSMSTWGPETVVVLDGLTGHAHAAFNRALSLMNKTIMGDMRKISGLGQLEQLAFIKLLTSVKNKFHVVVISHLKMIGPEEVEKNDDEITRTNKQLAAEIGLPTRLFPTALGKQLAQNISGEFPIVLRTNVIEKAGKGLRVIEYLPTKDVDIKLPVKDLASLGTLSIADGMLKIFKALGHTGEVQ